jgi:NAD(P)-dependent dehydrogenase (short-subunit alcohol dehydrogenase family)
MTTQADLRVSNLFKFDRDVALITGGASGLGEMAAQAFVQNGAKVFIASRKESELKQVGNLGSEPLPEGSSEVLIVERARLRWRRGLMLLDREVANTSLRT